MITPIRISSSLALRHVQFDRTGITLQQGLDRLRLLRQQKVRPKLGREDRRAYPEEQKPRPSAFGASSDHPDAGEDEHKR